MSEPCQCQEPGHCAVFNRPIVGRLWEICQGVRCTPQLTEAYRTIWSEPYHDPLPGRLPRHGRCKHLGEPTGARVACLTCFGRVELKLHECALHRSCTLGKVIDGFACCETCEDYDGQSAADTA